MKGYKLAKVWYHTGIHKNRKEKESMSSFTQEISIAFGELNKATIAYTTAFLEKAKYKATFEDGFQRGLAAGEFVGKNEAERLGAFRLMNTDFMDQMDAAEVVEIMARLHLTLAQNRVKELGMLLRLQEVEGEENEF
jgi:hypothetical protein